MVDHAIERPRRDRYFWLPVWILLAGVAGSASFELGAHITERQWSEEENASLAIAAMRHPASALEEAESRLLADRIDFAVYRDLLRAALSRPDGDLLNAANQSIARVLASGREPAKKLEKELESLPTQVFIATSDRDSQAASNLEQKLQRRETVVVIPETRGPKTGDAARTEVLYSEAARQTAEYVTSLLREEGFAINETDVKKSEGGATPFKKRVEIILAKENKAEPNSAPAPRKLRKPRKTPTRHR